jgi:pimeloyl-ACP methyl ester carboxylesterase
MHVKKTAISAAVILGAAYCAYLCGLFFLQGSLIYPGTSHPVNPVAPRVTDAEWLSIPSEAGRTEALFLPASADALIGPRPLMIFAHGNGEVIDDWLTALHGFHERGIGVLLVEYPGYGRSGGSPSEKSIQATMGAAYDRIVTDPRVDRARIFGFGQSLGGGAICLLAKDRPLKALILQSTFTSLDGFAASWGAPAFLLRSHFDNLSSVQRFSGPLLVIHGRDDRLIPWEQGRRLASAAADANFKLYACGHGCWDPERLPFWKDADKFLIQAGILDQ